MKQAGLIVLAAVAFGVAYGVARQLSHPPQPASNLEQCYAYAETIVQLDALNMLGSSAASPQGSVPGAALGLETSTAGLPGLHPFARGAASEAAFEPEVLTMVSLLNKCMGGEVIGSVGIGIDGPLELVSPHGGALELELRNPIDRGRDGKYYSRPLDVDLGSQYRNPVQLDILR